MARNGSRRGRWTDGLRSMASLAAIGLAAVFVSPAVIPLPAALAGANQHLLATDATMDRLIMKSGNVVTGEILEETDTTVRMRVVVAGISSVTTYQKSDILSIERAEKPGDGDKDEQTKEAKESGSKTDQARTPSRSGRRGEDESTGRNTAADENAAQIYHVRLRGLFGEDLSETGLRNVIRDIDRVFNDKVERVVGGKTTMIVDEPYRSRNIVVLEVDFEPNRAAPGFDQIWRCEEISPLLEAEMEAGRRIVFWVDSAPQGAAFLPWISPEIYFRPGGIMGGIGDLASGVAGMQDEEVREKQISLRLGHAEGRVIKGGRPDLVPVVRAMARPDYWLAVRFVGGRPQFLNHQPREQDGPGWTILSDDGQGDNEDDEESLEQNDIVNLDAEWAQRLGLSLGTIASMADLTRALGVGDNWKMAEGARGQQIYDAWREEVDRAWRQAKPNDRRFQGDRPIGEKWEEYGRVQGGDARAIGQRIRILGEIKSIVARYAEFMDRDGGLRTQIQDQIDQLRIQLQLMRRSN